MGTRGLAVRERHYVRAHAPTREGLLPGFIKGSTKIHHDEHCHIGYGIWFLRQAVLEDNSMGDVVRESLRELLPAAES